MRPRSTQQYRLAVPTIRRAFVIFERYTRANGSSAPHIAARSASSLAGCDARSRF